jgi:hypothetical protein
MQDAGKEGEEENGLSSNSIHLPNRIERLDPVQPVL